MQNVPSIAWKRSAGMELRQLMCSIVARRVKIGNSYHFESVTRPAM